MTGNSGARFPGKAASVTRRVRGTVSRLCRAGLRAAGAPAIPAVLILGHMRSGSTLLLHLLLTHPDITGCGERNVAYRSREDFYDLALAARTTHFAPFRSFRYVVDQINHDPFTPDAALLHDPGVRLLFLTRDPAESIGSILRLTRDFYQEWSVEKALAYYVERLATLARIAQGMPDSSRAAALTYQDLVANTSATFQRLRRFLDLESGFSEDYAIQSFTGKRGDPSKNIRAGRIVRNRPGKVPGNVREIPDRELEKAWQSYRACQLAMSRFAGGGLTGAG